MGGPHRREERASARLRVRDRARKRGEGVGAGGGPRAARAWVRAEDRRLGRHACLIPCAQPSRRPCRAAASRHLRSGHSPHPRRLEAGRLPERYSHNASPRPENPRLCSERSIGMEVAATPGLWTLDSRLKTLDYRLSLSPQEATSSRKRRVFSPRTTTSWTKSPGPHIQDIRSVWRRIHRRRLFGSPRGGPGGTLKWAPSRPAGGVNMALVAESNRILESDGKPLLLETVTIVCVSRFPFVWYEWHRLTITGS